MCFTAACSAQSHRPMEQEEAGGLPMLAAELLVLLTVDSSDFDNALQGFCHFAPFGHQVFAVATPA